MAIYINKISGISGTNINKLDTYAWSGLYSVNTVLIQSADIGYIAGGLNHTIYIKNDGRLYAWGNNTYGELGINNATNISCVSSVLGAVKTFCSIGHKKSSDHSFAIEKNGKLWGWGINQYGQLGTNDNTCYSTPVAVAGNKTFCHVTGGAFHTLGIDKNGKGWGWGFNNYGQMGDGGILISSKSPKAICTTRTFCKINAGYGHSLAIGTSGDLYLWGYNNFGQLGDRTVTNKNAPAYLNVGDGEPVCEISAGQDHTVVIDSNGKTWAWGRNVVTGRPDIPWGCLGDNTVTNKSSPVAVCGGHTFCKVAAGVAYCLAIDKNGKMWSWGYNNYGQLGNNDTTSYSTPIAVSGAAKTFCRVEAGDAHSLAIDKNGDVWAWGLNTSGQLDSNSTTSRLTPYKVTTL